MTTFSISGSKVLADSVEIGDIPALANPARIDIWSVPTEYRSTGYFVATTANGQTAEIPACGPGQAEHVATLEAPVSDAATAEHARAERLAAANLAAESMLTTLDASYPDREVLTWDQQLREAEAVTADAQAPALLLRSLAVTRGIDLQDLAGRVLAKSALYKAAVGQVLGARQWVEDELTAAATHDDVLAVPTVEQRIAEVGAQ